jgi:hypothetical protein
MAESCWLRVFKQVWASFGAQVIFLMRRARASGWSRYLVGWLGRLVVEIFSAYCTEMEDVGDSRE